VLKRLHILSILLEWITALSRTVIPLLLLYMQTRDKGGRIIAILGASALAFTALWSVASYLATRYGVSDVALLVRSGVLRRQSRVIPFSRIQSVNVQQKALQRVFGVAELRVETATQGSEAEAVLSVLRWSDAQALREQLVAARLSAIMPRAAAAQGTATDEPASAAPTAPAPELIAAIDVEELMVAGGTSNNIGVLLALLISGCERFGSSFMEGLLLPGGLGTPLNALSFAMGNTWAIALLVLVGVIPILFASWLVSVAGSVIRYYGFTLERAGRDLRRRHGLFSRVEASVPMARAQALRFKQSLLRRPFGRGELLLVSAGSVASRENAAGGQQHLMPILRVEHVAALVAVVFPDAAVADVLAAKKTESVWRRAAPVSWLRNALTLSVQLSVLLGVLVLWRGDSWWSAAWLFPLVWLLARARWRARGLTLVPGYVLVRQGGLSRTTVIMPENKLQLIEVQQGPLQRLFGLATLHLTTAGQGGEASMVDLPLAEARAVRDDLAARLPRSVRTSERINRRVVSPSSSRTTPEFLSYGARI
jgi:putative membrane protein